MQRLIAGLLVLALVGAGATVWLVNSYIDKRVQDTEKKAAPVMSASKVVLVARQNIPIGKKIATSDMEWLAWPDQGVQGQFLSANQPDNKLAGKMVGAIARRGIIKGTPLTEEAVFRTATPGFLAGTLDPKMRAVSISITAETGASGFIMPGDRVDVILLQDLSRAIPGKETDTDSSFKPYVRYTAETVLQNLRVLAVDQKVDDFEKKAQISKTVTVEVTPKQAEALALVRAMGKIGLTLRSFVDNNAPGRPGPEQAVAEKTPDAAEGAVPVVATAISTPGAAGERVGAMSSGEETTVTTDIEISPILAGSVATASGPVKPVVKPSPPPSSSVQQQRSPARSSIRIYRGGEPSTVNF